MSRGRRRLSVVVVIADRNGQGKEDQTEVHDQDHDKEASASPVAVKRLKRCADGPSGRPENAVPEPPALKSSLERLPGQEMPSPERPNRNRALRWWLRAPSSQRRLTLPVQISQACTEIAGGHGTEANPAIRAARPRWEQRFSSA